MSDGMDFVDEQLLRERVVLSVRGWLVYRGMTMESLAYEANIPVRTLARRLSLSAADKKMMDLNQFFQIAKALKVHPMQLLELPAQSQRAASRN